MRTPDYQYRRDARTAIDMALNASLVIGDVVEVLVVAAERYHASMSVKPEMLCVQKGNDDDEMS
ncbi:MAG: hypothetical protein V3T88_09175 [Nitrosomonadaceae bacterium]